MAWHRCTRFRSSSSRANPAKFLAKSRATAPSGTALSPVPLLIRNQPNYLFLCAGNPCREGSSALIRGRTPLGPYSRPRAKSRATALSGTALLPVPTWVSCPPPPTLRAPNHPKGYVERAPPRQPRSLAPQTCWAHLTLSPPFTCTKLRTCLRRDSMCWSKSQNSQLESQSLTFMQFESTQ